MHVQVRVHGLPVYERGQRECFDTFHQPERKAARIAGVLSLAQIQLTHTQNKHSLIYTHTHTHPLNFDDAPLGNVFGPLLFSFS